MHRPDVAVLTSSNDDILRDGHHTVDPIRMTGELVRVEAVLTPGSTIVKIQANVNLF